MNPLSVHRICWSSSSPQDYHNDVFYTTRWHHPHGGPVGRLLWTSSSACIPTAEQYCNPDLQYKFQLGLDYLTFLR